MLELDRWRIFNRGRERGVCLSAPGRQMENKTRGRAIGTWEEGFSECPSFSWSPGSGREEACARMMRRPLFPPGQWEVAEVRQGTAAGYPGRDLDPQPHACACPEREGHSADNMQVRAKAVGWIAGMRAGMEDVGEGLSFSEGRLRRHNGGAAGP